MPIPFTSDQEHQILTTFMNGTSITTVAQQFHVDHSRIKAVVVKRQTPVFYFGLRTSDGKRVPIETQNEITTRYQAGEPYHPLAKEYRVGYQQIVRMLTKRGVALHDRKHTARYGRETLMTGHHIQGALFCRWKHGARNRRGPRSNLTFEVTHEHLENLWQRQGGLCYYTGIPMHGSQHCTSHKDLRKDPLCVSLDRIDSAQGYVEGNVALCCQFVNFMKSDYTKEELCAILSQIKNN